MRRLLFLIVLCLTSFTLVHGQARTADQLMPSTVSHLENGNPPNGSIRYVIDGTPNTRPCTAAAPGATTVGAIGVRTQGAWSCLPRTLALGVTTFNARVGAVLPAQDDYTFGQLASKPTTLSGYGITDAQALDSDLTAIAGLSPLNDDVIQRKAGTWVNRTPAQLKTDLALTKSDVALGNVPNIDATNPANISQDATHRFTTDAEKATWNGKQDALGFTPENVANKSTGTSLGASDTLYPTQNAVKTYVDTGLALKAPLASPALTGTPTVPTAAVDTNTTQAASTAFVLAQAASANPIINGTATPGTSTRYARADHVHPTDTSRAPTASPTFTGTVTIPTPFTLGAVSVTSTGTQLNYLNAATGTTGTTSSNVVFSASPTFTGTVGGTNVIPLTVLAQIATNTIAGNATSGTANITALAIGSCSTAGSALIWTTNTGFGCNTSITAAAAPISGLTGAGTGVLTALSVNVGSAGAPLLFNGAGGTPSSITLTNGTGLPTTGLTGTLQAAQEPAHTGDVTNSAGSLALSIAANAVTLAKLATQATNTVLGNATSGTAVPTALAVGSCSTSGSALIWTTNTGFGCNTSITANTAATATTATNATNGTTVAVSNSASYFPLFAASSSNGNQPFNLGTGLTFNPSTNTLTTTTFSGALSGNASTVTGFTAGAGTLTGPASAGVAVTLGNNETITGIKTFSPTARSSGTAAYFTINVPADTGITAATESIGENHVTGTRTWADGTVALQRERFWAGPTYNKTTTSATFTDVFNAYFTPPVAGTGVTFTRGHTLGIVDSTSASSSITGGFVVAATLGTTATSVGIGGGNVNAGGNGTFGGTLSVTGHTTFEGVTSTGATGSGKLVYDTSPTIATPVINSAAHVGGTWVADATWTLPAVTLGSTVSGGGNQLNNVVIGASTPLAGSFTTIAGTTSVYVGTGSASGGTFKFEADPGISSVVRMRLGGNGAATHLAFNLALDTAVGTLSLEEGVGGASRLSITQAGLVSIPAISSDATHTDSTVCQDTTTHALYAGSGTLGVCLGTSSVRYKDNIAPLNVGLDALMALRPVSYQLKREPGKTLYGFTAEQGGSVLPILMGRDAAGQPNTFDYLGVIPVAVKAIQEMQREIDELKAKVKP